MGTLAIPRRVKITEVGPRDGFQAEKTFIPTDLKVDIINSLSRAGLSRIEATSFVSPRVIPQLADAEEVMRRIDRVPGVCYTVLVPNRKGAERAAAARPGSMRIFFCTTESYNRKNVGRGVEESINESAAVFNFARGESIAAEAIIGLSFGCPLEGPVAPERVEYLVGRLRDIGFREIAIADSIGVATPQQVYGLMQRLVARFPDVEFPLHLHDTRGLALSNALAGMLAGVAAFDSAIGGLGGPSPSFGAVGSTGNICSEDLAHMLEEMEVETGVNTEALIACAGRVQQFLNRTLPSHVLQSGTRSRLFAAIAAV